MGPLPSRRAAPSSSSARPWKKPNPRPRPQNNPEAFAPSHFRSNCAISDTPHSKKMQKSQRFCHLDRNFFEETSVYSNKTTRGVGGYHHRATDRQLPPP